MTVDSFILLTCELTRILKKSSGFPVALNQKKTMYSFPLISELFLVWKWNWAKMALLHKALFTWFIVLVFLVLLVLRLDERVSWNWFLIFIPLWVFDGVCIIYIVINMIMHCKNDYDRNEAGMSMKRKIWFIVTALLKIIFQILVCLKLQYYNLTLYYVLIPFWALIIGVIIDITYGLFAVWY